LKESDFAEGVRAMVIDKDKSPKWLYKAYDPAMEEEIINRYFN
jgi:hypothetical protein